MASDPCDETAIAHWQGLYEREKAARWELEKERGEVNAALKAEMTLAEEMTKCGLKLSVEVSEQKARADAAEADLRFARLAEKERAKVQESFEAALAAARRSLENVRALAARASVGKRPLLRDEIRHILRFCEEAGVTGSVLREGAAPAAGRGAVMEPCACGHSIEDHEDGPCSGEVTWNGKTEPCRCVAYEAMEPEEKSNV